MGMIQMVLTLIWAKRKTTLNCMSSLSVCLVPNVHCKRSQQLRTIYTCVTDYTQKCDTRCRCKDLLEQNGFSVSQPLVLCLRNAFDITIRQTIKRYDSATRTMLCTTDGMVYYSSHQSSIYWNNSSMHWNEIFNLFRCKVEWKLEADSGFTNPFSSSFEDIELYFLSFGVPAKPCIAKDLIEADDIGRKVAADFIDSLLLKKICLSHAP